MGRVALAVVLAVALAAASAKPTNDANEDSAAGSAEAAVPAIEVAPGGFRWWQTGIVYQVYPASFKDSDGDGIGDLKGITSKLDYLKDIGVAAVWLSPIFKSPDKDMGYDISDFKDIHPNYGTLNDFQEMVDTAHDLGLKVVLDFVPNHSSDEHEWFQAAAADVNSPYHDYYVWHEGIRDGETREPPNKWVSVFDGKTAWKYVEAVDKYYLHNFHEGQPDLNYRNATLVEEMKDVFRFWIRKGVDGFRIDAIPYLFEDKKWRDNPDVNNKFTENLDETYDMVQQWREVFAIEGERMNKDVLMMLEAYAGLEKTMKYFGTADRPAGHFPFNFFIISNIRQTSTAEDFKTAIELWTDNVPYFGWSNWVVGNHDNHRVGSRLREDLIDGINMLVTLLPGTAVTYYGEEIGMLDNPDLKLTNCKDPQACPDGADEKYYQEHSRDFERTPFHWDGTAHAGFTTGTPWLPVATDYVTINVEAENTTDSHLGIYKKLAQLRNEHVIQAGDLRVEVLGANVLSFTRDNGTHVCLVLISLNDTEEFIDVKSTYGNLGDLQVYVSSNFESTDINLADVKLPGYASVVLHGPRFKWWQTGIIYQIYPRSFQDSDGDGQGDIPGITSRLEYLRDIGVAAVWLSPIYESPDMDWGYDISNFREIHKDFGNMADFENMVDKAHELGLKVILDLVPNHSSDKSEWFQGALEGEKNKYFRWYVWEEGIPSQDPTEPHEPPNTWQSVFGGSAWEYVPELDLFYLHQFYKEQPDLNYRYEEVVDEMKDIIRFWLQYKKVDGFRIDAIPHLFEDASLNFTEDNPGDSQFMKHQPETFDMVQQWRELVDEIQEEEQRDIVLMLEAYADIETTMKYFGTEERPGGHFPFNFFIMNNIKEYSKAADVKNSIEDWLDNVPNYGWSNWVLGNHDKNRVGSRLAEDLIEGMNMIATLLPGTAITYQGEEIGMLDNTELTIDDCKDYKACTDGNETVYQSESRDFERTPFQWDTSKYAGFTTADSEEPWLPLPSDYSKTNVEVEEKDPKSHLSVYKQLSQLRRQPHIQSGEVKIEVLGDNVLAFSRSNRTYATLVLVNFGSEYEIVNVAEKFEELGEMKEYTSYRFSSSYQDLSTILLSGHSSVVLQGPIKDLRQESTELKWWKTGIVYQIYPRSFQDSNDDGKGDLKGITSRLGYLKNLGVTAIWLSPIFKSPDYDLGYDISDFKDIDENYGNLADFDEMVAKAHELGMKVILDFVPNHSSNESEWFTKAMEEPVEGNRYFDYYVWKEVNEDGSPPNNWMNVFDKEPGSGWECLTEGHLEGMCYLHQFHKAQPDLNYSNPDVVQEMKDVLSFWIARGVDGFRVDAIQHLFEDETFADNEPENEAFRQKDYPGTHEMIKQWRELLDREGSLRGKELVLMLEVYANTTILQDYFGSELRHEGHFPFNFLILSMVKDDSSASYVVDLINEWLEIVPSFGWSNWVVGNHDNHRVGSRMGQDMIDAMNMLVTLLPGTAITYNGEEIGMVDGNFGVGYCQDPQACPDGDKTPETDYKEHTRDFERTPFQWDSSDNAGFSTVEPWLPINDDYKEVNVEVQNKSSTSHLSVYKKLVHLRKQAAEISTEISLKTLNDDVLAFLRGDDDLVYLVLINFSDKDVPVDVTKEFDNLPTLKKYVSYNFDDELDLANIKLGANASVVLVSEDFVVIDVGGGNGASSATPFGLLLVVLLFISRMAQY